MGYQRASTLRNSRSPDGKRSVNGQALAVPGLRRRQEPAFRGRGPLTAVDGDQGPGPAPSYRAGIFPATMSASPSLAQTADRFGWSAQSLSRDHARALLACARRIEAAPPSRPLAGRHLAIATPTPRHAGIQQLRDRAVGLGARVSLIPVPSVDERSVAGVDDTCRVLARMYDALIVPDASPAWLAWLAGRCPMPVLGDLVSAASPAWLAACALAIEPDKSTQPPVLVLLERVGETVCSAWEAVGPVVGLDVRPRRSGVAAPVPDAWWQLDVDDQGQPQLVACDSTGTTQSFPADRMRQHHAAMQEAFLRDALGG